MAAIQTCYMEVFDKDFRLAWAISSGLSASRYILANAAICGVVNEIVRTGDEETGAEYEEALRAVVGRASLSSYQEHSYLLDGLEEQRVRIVFSDQEGAN